MSDLKIAIILGSTRPGRKGDQVARWVLDQAAQRGDAEYELVDLADFPLPHLDEAMPPMMGQYANDHTKQWAAKIGQYDGYIFVTPEYNHSTSGVLKNAIDYLNAEWNNKAAAFVSYGFSSSGTRAVEHLRLVVGELQMADVQRQVAISIPLDFENYETFRSNDQLEANLGGLFDQLLLWSGAMQSVRAAAAVAA